MKKKIDDEFYKKKMTTEKPDLEKMLKNIPSDPNKNSKTNPPIRDYILGEAKKVDRINYTYDSRDYIKNGILKFVVLTGIMFSLIKIGGCYSSQTSINQQSPAFYSSEYYAR